MKRRERGVTVGRFLQDAVTFLTRRWLRPKGGSMITGRTELIAHLGYPTVTFASSSICNPWFEKHGIDAAVVPMSAKSEGYSDLFRSLFSLTNLRGALVTMPHKITTLDLVDEVAPAAAIAGATNAVVRREDGSLLADQFDGAGFLRAIVRKGFEPQGKRVLIIGAGGVGSAIAASLAEAQVGEINLVNRTRPAAEGLASRLQAHYPEVHTNVEVNEFWDVDLIVNATSLGTHADDPLPLELSSVSSTTLVADVVNKPGLTPFLAAARDRGCSTQVGSEMLMEMVPAYLSFFGYAGATVEDLS